MSDNEGQTRSNPLSRRRLLRDAGIVAATLPAAALLGSVPDASAATRTQTAPLPPTAKGPTIPASGYLVTELGDSLFWLTDGIYQMIFLVTDDGVVAVDAPPTLGNNILRAIRTVTTKPVTHAVYSHHHADHTGAMVLYDGAELYAQTDAARLIRQANDPNRPNPRHVFPDSRVLNVGGHVLRLDYHGPNHSPGNLHVYAPAQRVLMLVDVVFPGWVPFAFLAESTNIPGWIEAHDQALNYPFTTLVGGHLTRLGTRDDVLVQQEYVGEMKTRTAAALDAVDLQAIFGSVDPSNLWAVFDAYLGTAATSVADAMTPEWISRLGGADVFTYSNAQAMVNSVRIDFGHLAAFGIHP